MCIDLHVEWPAWQKQPLVAQSILAVPKVLHLSLELLQSEVVHRQRVHVEPVRSTVPAVAVGFAVLVSDVAVRAEPLVVEQVRGRVVASGVWMVVMTDLLRTLRL